MQRLLEELYSRWAEGSESGLNWDWALEKGKLRQCVMRGMAINAPAPPPPPSDPRYPPLLVLRQLSRWLSHPKMIFGRAQPCLFEESPAFRDYVMSSLHLMGFLLSSLVERLEEGPLLALFFPSPSQWSPPSVRPGRIPTAP